MSITSCFAIACETCHPGSYNRRVPWLLLQWGWQGASVYAVGVCHACWVFLTMTKLLIHGVALSAGLMMPTACISANCCLKAACWWISAGFQGVFLGSILRSTSIWSGLHWNLPKPMKQFGKKKLMRSSLVCTTGWLIASDCSDCDSLLTSELPWTFSSTA